VESLRALAALGVLVAHAFLTARTAHGMNPPSPSGVFDRLVVTGTFSVYLFFVLSGYLLFWPFVKHAFANGRSIDLRRYAVNRALRILPLYYVALVAYLVLMAGGGTLEQWLTFWTFSENFSAGATEAVNPVLWSLVVELHFYVVLPLLALLIWRLAGDSPRRAMAVVVGVGLASFVVRWVTLYDDPTPNPYLRYSLPSCFMFFAPGMALALLRLMWERRPVRLLAGPLGAPGLWLAGALGAWLLLALDEGRGYLAAVASFLLVGAVVLPLRYSRLPRALEWRPLAAVGVVSYSLYLWHVLILRKFTEHFGLDSFGPLLAVGLPVSLAIAFASYAIVERPFLRMRRRWGSTAAESAAERTKEEGRLCPPTSRSAIGS